MAEVQRRNDELAALLGADHLPLLDRNIAFEAYDDAGGQTFVDSLITVNLDMERVNTAPTVFGLASDVVTVSQAGIYLVTWHVTVGHSAGASDAVAEMHLEEDSGSGFGAVTATYEFVPVQGTGYGSGQGMAVLRIAAGNSYRLRVERGTGSDTLVLLTKGARLGFVCLIGTG